MLKHLSGITKFVGSLEVKEEPPPQSDRGGVAKLFRRAEEFSSPPEQVDDH